VTAEPFSRETVRGFLHRPAGEARDALVLTHGAGGNCHSPLLVSISEAIAAAGWLVLRCNLPYRQQRPSGPPRPGDAARDRQGLRQAIAAMRSVAPGRIFLGGQSYGGRQATLAAAEDPELTRGLLLLSYPLHPPGKPDQPRTDHFPRLRSPALFAHGSRDPFGTLEEVRAAITLIPAWTELLVIDNAGHDLRARNSACAVVTAFLKFAEGTDAL